MERLAERTAVRIAIFSIIALVLVWTMLPTAGWLNEFRDAQVLTLHERAAVDSVTRFGQLPLWDPWYCGGLYGLGEPQSRFASPPFFLSVIFGVERAEVLVIFLFTVLGMEGMYRWVRLRVNDATAALRVAPLFALCGHFAVAYYRGWTNFFGFELLPFVLYGITLTARGRTGGIATASIAFATMIGFGGTFAAPLVVVAGLIEGIRALSEQPPNRRLRSIVMLGSLAIFIATVAAVRLLPIAETLSAQPRIMAGVPGHAPKTLLYFLVKSLDVKGGDVDEPGAFFMGAAFLALVALGGSDRKSIRPLAIVIIFLWLAAGYARKPALFALLRELPIFSALRYPERFLWIAIAYACEPAANALAKLPRLGDGKKWRIGANVVLTLAVLATIGSQIATYADVGKARELGVVAVNRMPEFRQARGNRWLAAHYDGVGAGSLSCWETHPVIMSPKLRGDLDAEEYIAIPGAGTAKRVSWSPQKLVVHASMDVPGRLLINQNWHPGWRSSVGTVVSEDGLLGIDLPKGEHDITVAFRPMSAIAGGTTTAVALLSLCLLGMGARRGRIPFRRSALVRTTAIVLAPVVVLGIFIATWSEPRYPQAPFRNANGSPALVAQVAPDATPINAQFAIPIVVDAVKLEGPDNLKNIGIDLYLRRTGPLPRTTGMFIHVERRAGEETIPEPPKGKEKEKPLDFYNADHQVVAASFYLSDAPEGIVVRDNFGVFVGKGARGAWDVWLAFGHVSGRRGRADIVSPGTTTVNEKRIKLASFFVR